MLGIDPEAKVPPNLSTDILERIEEADGTRRIIVKTPMNEVLEIYGQHAPDNIHLLKVGQPEVAGGGCMCGSHTCVSEIIHTALSDENEHFTVLDMEASMEHMKRGTARHVDVMITVVEPYYRSLEAGGRFADMAKDLGIKRVIAIANKVRNKKEEAAVNQFCSNKGLELVGVIPFDNQVTEADLLGKSIMDYDNNSIIVNSLQSLIGEIIDN